MSSLRMRKSRYELSTIQLLSRSACEPLASKFVQGSTILVPLHCTDVNPRSTPQTAHNADLGRHYSHQTIRYLVEREHAVGDFSKNTKRTVPEDPIIQESNRPKKKPQPCSLYASYTNTMPIPPHLERERS